MIKKNQRLDHSQSNMNELKQNTEKDWKNYETNNKTIALNVLLSQSNKTSARLKTQCRT